MAEFGNLIFQKSCHALDLLHCLGVTVWAVEARGSQKGQILFNVRQLLVQILATFVALLLKCLCSQTSTWKSTFNIGCLRFNVQWVKEHPLTVSLFVMVTPSVKNQHQDSPNSEFKKILQTDKYSLLPHWCRCGPFLLFSFEMSLHLNVHLC